MIQTIETVLGLLIAVAGLALLSRRVPVPFPILLVAGGLLLGLIPGVPLIHLNPEVIFLLFLPPLLYPAALFMPWRDFRHNLRPILLLAIGLVLFTTLVVGWLAHQLIAGWTLAAGCVLGAIVSPPDAVAAAAIAERLRIPRRIVAILEGESLVNDATALVAFSLATTAVVTGSYSLVHAGGQFLLVALGGIAIGLIVGFATAWIAKQIDDPPIEITISLLTPFAAYLPAEQLGLSGVLAVVTAGLYHGWHAPEFTTPRSRLQAGPVWEMIQFLLNGFIFILIGLQLPGVLRGLTSYSIPQLAGYAAVVSLAVILVRLLWVFPASYLPRLLSKKLRARDPYPGWRNVFIVAWTGMRGVVSLAAALSLPLATRDGRPFPGRDLILFLTFVVILATLVVQGLSLPVILRRLGVQDDRSAEREETEARLKANQAALDRLNELTPSQTMDEEAWRRLRAEYEDRIHQLGAAEYDEMSSSHGLFSSTYERLSRAALKAERHTILHLRNTRFINDEVMRRIERDIDLAEARLRRRD